jgi:hypothetical protein
VHAAPDRLGDQQQLDPQLQQRDLQLAHSQQRDLQLAHSKEPAMSITTQALRFALIAAVVCAGSTADAKPRRLVIVDFDGPRQLADAGRSAVLSVLGEYDIVATKRWEQARQAASQQLHGPAQWSKASKQAGVDAVIEGWVQDEGRRKILNVTVRDASTGREFDTLSIRLDARNGMSSEGSRKLKTDLEEVLDWIDAGFNEPPAIIPPINARKIGPSYQVDDGETRVRRRRPIIDDDEDVGEPRRRARRTAEIEDGEDDRAPRAERDDRAPRAERDDRDVRGEATDDRVAEATTETTAETAETSHDATAVEVATAREAKELEAIFPQSSEDRVRILGPKANHVPQRTRRFLIDGGLYLGSRSLVWDTEPDSFVMQYAGVSSKGLAVNAAIYPFPLKQMDGVVSGVGFTGSLHHSVGSTVVFPDVDVVEEYVINQNGWELGAHYRAPLNGMVAIDGGAFYGNQTYQIVDASEAFEVPDTKYSYLGLGAHLDLSITERAMIGFGARYFTVLDAGDLAGVDWFGPADASGLGVHGSFVVPLPASLYVRGELSYQRISLELTGGGIIADEEGISSGTDALIRGHLNVGIAF